MASRFADIDDFDRAILAVVQKDRSTPLRMIAERVNLSTAATQRRLKRLEDIGVIRSSVALVDPTLVGKSITVIVEVRLEHGHLEALKKIKEQLSGPDVQQCYYVTGETDFVLIINVATMEEYMEIAQRILYPNADVKWFRSIVVMDRVKVGLEVPLDSPVSGTVP